VDGSQRSPELDALELHLQQLPGQPTPELRGRVLRYVAEELRRQRLYHWCWYAAAVAAMLVLWANLSWTASRDTSYDWRVRGGGQISVEQIEQLVPGLSRREAARQAFVLSGGVRIPAGEPALGPVLSPLRSNRSYSF
jgi:hypothetical protein